MSLFGSVLRDDFDAKKSDVDVLAEFEPAALAQTGWEYFRYGGELRKILGHRVEFCSQLDKRFAAEVRNQALTIHEQS